MRIPPRFVGLLALGSGLVGCSQTGGFRAVAPSEVKTTASVGDKPVSVVAGLPGDDLLAQRDLSSGPRSDPKGRLSGRVYDEDGNPVRNAVVRLALDGAAGGKAVHATTDRSGAFTLRGLRPGSSYTVIAEYQGEQGVLTGRADADAPDSDVRISLRPRDAAIGDERLIGAAPEPSKVRSIARSREVDPGEGDPEAERPRPVRPRLDTADETGREAEPGWSAGGSPRPRKGAATPPPPADEDPIEFDDDGENPLPPAREISRVSARDDDGFTPASDDEAPSGDSPRSLPDGLIEERGREHDRFAPLPFDDIVPSEEAAPSRGNEPGPESKKPRRTTAEPAVERERPTWSEVVSQHQTTIPVDEAIAQTEATVSEPAPPAEKPVPAVAVAAEPSRVEPAPARTKSARPAALAARTASPAEPAAPPAARKGPYCDYDPDERRILDFALPDMEGKMVSLRDFDADLILLDFWGTWCAECRTSIDHMKELQDRLGGKKLQVISLAYEKSEGPDRIPKLKEVAEKLGINYPILVRGLQEECPVFEALQVQFFPTMILLDREGKILRREQGATAETLARIDRTIAESLDGGGPAFARRQPIGRTTR